MTVALPRPLRALPLCLCFCLCLCLAACGGSDEVLPRQAGGGARVFAVGLKQLPGNAASYDAFRHKIFSLMEGIEPDRAADRPNLVCFPEDTALAAVLIGSRGEAARGMSGMLPAILSLTLNYLPQVLHYLDAHPGVSLQRALLLSLTDTIYRAFFETFRDLARTHGVWVEACTVVAPVRVSESPEDIDFFGDPDLDDPGYVYLPEGRDVYNTAFLFDPQGNIVLSTHKVHLVSLEGPELLDLTPGALEDVAALDAPWGRLGIAICFDAFHADYMERMNALGCAVVIQPSANPAPWAAPSQTYDWQPEEWLNSAHHDVTDPAYPAVRYVVNPMLTGNLFEIAFDGQSAVTARHPAPGAPPANYVGLDPVPGFVRVAPWVVPDPGLADPGLGLEQRRALLNEVALQLAPGSGSGMENAYLETAVRADIP